MSNNHGRCFRAAKRTKLRKARQGIVWESHPTRWKVPLAIRPFLTGAANQMRAQHDAFGNAIARYTKHQAAVGGKPVVIQGGDQVSDGPERPAESA